MWRCFRFWLTESLWETPPASVGGASISQLQNNRPEVFRTPPGFSRWFFNFRGYQIIPNRLDPFVAPKLKYHRLKPVVSAQYVKGVLCSWKDEVPPAEAGGVLQMDELESKSIQESLHERQRSITP
jgi:hypothetical protein